MEEKEKIELHARLAAIEHLTCFTYNMMLANLPIPLGEAEISTLEDVFKDKGQPTIGISDPAMSDHVHAEISAAQERLLGLARDLRAVQFAGR